MKEVPNIITHRIIMETTLSIEDLIPSEERTMSWLYVQTNHRTRIKFNWEAVKSGHCKLTDSSIYIKWLKLYGDLYCHTVSDFLQIQKRIIEHINPSIQIKQ